MSKTTRMPATCCLLFATVASLAAGCGGEYDDAAAGDTEVEASALTSTIPLYLRQIAMWDAHEPFTKGDPEIFVKCITASGKIGRKDLTNVDKTIYSYTPNVKVMDVATSEAFVDCEVWEDDGNDGNDFVGHVVVATPKLLEITTTTDCAGTTNVDVQLGVSRIKGRNLCPELAQFGYSCDEYCANTATSHMPLMGH